MFEHLSRTFSHFYHSKCSRKESTESKTRQTKFNLIKYTRNKQQFQNEHNKRKTERTKERMKQHEFV